MIPYELYIQHDEMGNAPHLMSETDRERVFGGAPDWNRAGGGARCSCGRLYYDHGPVVGAMWLTRLCDDTFVKL